MLSGVRRATVGSLVLCHAFLESLLLFWTPKSGAISLTPPDVALAFLVERKCESPPLLAGIGK